MRYLKYEFTDKAEFDALKELHLMTGEGEEKYPINGVDVVLVPKFTITQAVMSEDGETVITPAVLSTMYTVDIIYRTIDPIVELDSFAVYPTPNAKHSVMGMDHYYSEEFYNKFPELRPVVEEIP